MESQARVSSFLAIDAKERTWPACLGGRAEPEFRPRDESSKAAKISKFLGERSKGCRESVPNPVSKPVPKGSGLSLESVRASFLEMQEKFKRGASGTSTSAGGSVPSPMVVETGKAKEAKAKEVRAIPEEAKAADKGKGKKRKIGEDKEEGKYVYPCFDHDDVAMEGARHVEKFVGQVDHDALMKNSAGIAMRLVGDLRMAYEDSMAIAHVVRTLSATVEGDKKELDEIKAALEKEKRRSTVVEARVDELTKELDLLKRQMEDKSRLLLEKEKLLQEKDKLLQERDNVLEANTREMEADALKWFVKGRVQTIQEWNERRDTWNAKEELAAFQAWYPGEDMEAPKADLPVDEEREVVADSDGADVEMKDAEGDDARPAEMEPEIPSPAKSATGTGTSRAEQNEVDDAVESAARPED